MARGASYHLASTCSPQVSKSFGIEGNTAARSNPASLPATAQERRENGGDDGEKVQHQDAALSLASALAISNPALIAGAAFFTKFVGAVMMRAGSPRSPL